MEKSTRFSKLACLLYEFSGKTKLQPAFMEDFLDSCTSETFADLYVDHYKKDLNPESLSNWMKSRPLPQWVAKAILANINETKLEEFLCKLIPSGDSFEIFVKEFRKKFPKCKIDDCNYIDKTLSILKEALEECAHPLKYMETESPKLGLDDPLLLKEEIEKLIPAIVKWKENDVSRIQAVNFNPATIGEKLYDDLALKTTVSAFVIRYFPAIDLFFENEIRRNSKQMSQIKATISNKYVSLRDLGHEKWKIFELMVNFIKEHTPNAESYNSKAFEIIVSYFIQLCEVFDAPSK